jgi:hypothetical protein
MAGVWQAGSMLEDIQVDNKQDSQHEAIRNVADRQKTQTFRQEAKQLGLLAAARQQEVDIVRWLTKKAD